MNATSGLMTLGFVSIFHIIGGIAIGVGLRRLVRGLSCQPLFFLVWGGLFGGLPLMIGATELAGKGLPIFFAAETAILLGTILISAFAPDWMIDAFRSQNIYLMLFGSAFLVVGIFAGLSTIRDQFLGGLLLLFLFGGVGVLVIVLGLKRLMEEK